MKEGYKLGLDIWIEWKCASCGKTKPTQDNEEWQQCCSELMKMQPMKKYKVLVAR